MPRISHFLVLVFLLLALGAGWATEVEYDLEFARYLQAQGEYYRAITEYHRVIFLAEKAPPVAREEALLAIGQCYFAGGEYSQASDWLIANRAELWSRPPESGAIDLMYRSLLRAGKPQVLLEVSRQDDLGDRRDYYFGLGQARMYHWDKAVELAVLVPEDSRWGGGARRLQEVSEKAGQARRCSPGVAGALGLIPGLGYAYTEHWQSAISALVLNGLFIYATAKSFDQGRDGQGAFFGVFALAWYSGSIFGSVKSAHRFNQVSDDYYWSQLEP